MSRRSVPVAYPELADISKVGLFREARRDENLDGLTRLTSTVLKSPIVLFCFLAGSRPCIRSDFGVPESWTSGSDLPLADFVCRHVAANEAPLIVGDTRDDPLSKTVRSTRLRIWQPAWGYRLHGKEPILKAAFASWTECLVDGRKTMSGCCGNLPRCLQSKAKCVWKSANWRDTEPNSSRSFRSGS